MRSPSVGAAWRRPWSAIAPRVTKLASSLVTLHAQVLRDNVVFGVIGATGAGAGHKVSCHEMRDGGMCLDHSAGERVAERDRRIELRENRADGVHEPITLDLAQDLAHQIRSGHGLADEARLGEAHELALGTGAD
jgi:hypothetical protein